MKKLIFILSMFVSLSTFASDCNVKVLGNLDSKNTAFSWNLLLDKGYYLLGSNDAKIIIDTIETGSSQRLVSIEVFDSMGNKIDEVSAMGANDLGFLNPSWKRLIRRAIKKLPNCH